MKLKFHFLSLYSLASLALYRFMLLQENTSLNARALSVYLNHGRMFFIHINQ